MAGGAGYAAGSILEKKFIKGRIGESLYDMIHPEDQGNSGGKAFDEDVRNRRQLSQIRNDLKIDIHFDELLRPFIRTGSMGTTASIKSMGRGDLFSALTSTAGL